MVSSFVQVGGTADRDAGIPRVMEGTLPSHFDHLEGDSSIRAAAKRWITSGRININARQVFPPGFQRPNA